MVICHQDIFNNYSNLTYDDVIEELHHMEEEEMVYKIPTYIFLATLFVIGSTGNITVCVIYHLKFPPNTPRLFIITLALFDALNCLVGIPFEIVDLRTDHFLDVNALCKIVRFSNTFSSCGSILTLLTISIDRYKKICRPFQKQILVSDAKKAIYSIVGIAVLFAIPALIFYGRHTTIVVGVETVDCSFDDMFRRSDFAKYYQIGLGVLCVLTITILVILYAMIVLKIIEQKKRRSAMTSVIRPTSGINVINQSQRNSEPHSDSDLDVSHAKSLPNRVNMSNARGDKTNTFSNRGNHPPTLPTSDTLDAKKKTKFVRSSRMTIMMLIVTIAFILGYMPHFGIQIARFISSDFTVTLHCSHLGLAVYSFFLRSYFFNSAINPIIYSCYNQRFRQECVTLLRRSCFCLTPRSGTITSISESES